MNVFELFATLGLDTTAYDEGLEGAETKGSSFGQKLGTVVGTGAKVAGAALAATGAAMVGVGTAFANGITSVAEYGDHVDKASQQMGISAEKYMEWDAILQHSGSSIDALRTGMRTLASAVETGNDAFERIGLTQEELANMDQEEIFAATIAGLQNVESTTERTYLAGQLLGRGATELGALLNTSAEDTEAMRQRVHELGGVLSDTAVKDAAHFQDSLQDLQTSFTGLKNNMMSEFLPSITTVMDGLTEVIIGNDSQGLGMIDQGISDFIDNLNSAMPRLLQVGGRIITSLITSISSNLPRLLSEGSAVLSELVQGIIIALPSLLQSAIIIISAIGQALVDNAELLLNTGLELIMILMNGLTEALPTAIPAIVSIITMIVTTLTSPENLDAFIQGALMLIMALADGIVAALPDLVAVIPTVIFNLTEAIINNFPEILNTVLYLIGALGYAILEALGSLLGQTLWELTEGFSNMFSKASDFGAKIGNWLRDKIQSGKTSVQNFFTSIGNFFTEGFNNIRNKVQTQLENIKNKFTSIFDNVKNVVHNAIEYIKGLFNFQWSLPHIKLPHFSITGQLDLLAVPPQIPSVSIEWYKKAMNEPYIMNGATIFGAANGRLLGGGESGSEVVVGTDKLMRMINKASGSNARDITINVYGAVGQDVRTLAKEVSKELQNIINDKEKVYA